MSKLRKKFITVLAMLVCTLLILSTALFIPKSETAKAYPASNINSSAVVVPELVAQQYLDGTDTQKTHAFNCSSLKILYQKLTGSTGPATLKDVSDQILNKQNEVTGGYLPDGLLPALNAQNLRNLNGGNDIIVEFGGYLWSAMYLTRTKEKTQGQNDGDEDFYDEY